MAFSFQSTEERKREEEERGWWTGPYGTRVPIHIEEVVAHNGYSILTRNHVLRNDTHNHINKYAWLSLYSEERDGILYYKAPTQWPNIPHGGHGTPF